MPAPEVSPLTRQQRWALSIAIVLACGAIVAGTLRALTGHPAHWDSLLPGLLSLSIVLGVLARARRPGGTR